jgi:hypothetical protein
VTTTLDLGKVVRQFGIFGDFVAAQPYGTAHINDTYAVISLAGTPLRFILQRVNCHLFKKPGALMDNVNRL